ncbi:efflux RND transporter periplasmic adaptor subunit [Larkinella humicola]|uniref:Efflux RND transporter periplasmic adaptor subunit n=1 Tax=Larkinella humicola TaxID=2607654 RepID=A0A5N1JQT0_9BACT|nr:efflux RND transporter periplasmic adaptor subunit [Larkinella humicola]KAA9356672.1 efflux RND transporter periplasmic adaptor subunit [Larkinella humicola]
MNRLINRVGFSVLAVISGILVVSSLNGCHSSDGKTEKTAVAEEPEPLEVIALRKGKLSSSLQIPGELVAFRDVDLYAKVSGFIKSIHADVGTEVKEGQLLALAEAPELNAQLAAAQSRLKSQEALYIASKANYDRYVDAAKTPGTVAQTMIEQTLAKKESDLAQLEAAKSSYREVADMRKYLEIRAPFSGIISLRNASTGAYIGPSGKGSEFPLFVLTEQKRLRLVIAVPEAYTGYVDLNDEVTFTVKAYPDKKFSGKVKRLAGALDKRLRSERTEVDVINTDRKLLPGMIAEVTIPLPTKNTTFVVPKSAVINATTGVFIVKVINQKAEWVPVQKGLEDGDSVEVFGEVKEGDQILTTATEEVRNGSAIRSVKQRT